ADEVVVHRVVVHAAGACSAIAICHTHVLGGNPAPVGQQAAGNDTIVGSYVVVAGREGNAVIHRSYHLVIVNVVEGRNFLRAVAGLGVGLDSATRVSILCCPVGVGALDIGVVNLQ